MIYKIFHIKDDFDKSNLQLENISHKFLYQCLLDDIKCYVIDNETKIYSFFGVCFFIKEFSDKANAEKFQKDFSIRDSYEYDIVENNRHYSSYRLGKEKTEQEISQILRATNTVKLSTYNCYDYSNIQVVFDSKSFCVYPKYKSDNDSFGRVQFMFLLCLAYNLKAEKLLNKVSIAYKNKNFNKMIELREDIYAFGLNNFFSNPVKQRNHQQYEIWKLLSNFYNVNDRYKEVKNQVRDLTKVIETKLSQEREKRHKKLNWIMGGMGLFISVMQLWLAFKP